MDQGQPRKPIRRTEGKQNAGHSNSTRSKVKRNSLSDDESSGSQVQQPPLKRQAKLCAKQTDKSVGMNNDDATSDSDPIDLNTLDEFTPTEAALQNDLVLETLFRYINQNDLLSCRTVNKQWQYESTKELRRRKLIIRFYFQSKGSKMLRNMASQDICRRLSECRTPSLLSSLQVKTVVPNDLASAGLFFITIGHQIKHLSLDLNYWSKKHSFESSSLATDLQNLLFRQAPNLEFLEIDFAFPAHWRDEPQLQLMDSSDQAQNDNDYLLLPKLKTFFVRGSPAPKFFADVINAAVNLRSFGGTGFAFSKYLMGAEGRAKIHQLKKIQLSVDSEVYWNERFLKEMETILAEHKENLKLEILECVFNLVCKNPCYSPRTVSVINQILECSAGSLQKLRIESAKYFDGLLIIPRSPTLQEIVIDCHGRHMRDSGSTFFPRRFNMNTSFPNISSIVLLNCTDFLFRQFVSHVAIELTEPVPSIRYIIILNHTGRTCDINPSLGTVVDFRHVFPNLVSISYGDDHIYKI